jgi:hypothetical protein
VVIFGSCSRSLKAFNTHDFDRGLEGKKDGVGQITLIKGLQQD